jgi:O-antigen/teichoic acid export membrane protein
VADAAAATRTSPDRHKDILATAKGGGFLVAGTVFEYGTRFLIALVLANGLGTEGYGLYVLGISAASLVAGVSLVGLDDAMVRYIAIHAGRDDEEGVSGTLQIGIVVSTITGLIAGTVLFVLAGPIANGLLDTPELEPLLRLFAIVVPFLVLSNVLLGTARGFRRMDYAALGEKVVQSLVRLVLVAILALVGHLNVYAAAVALGLADVAASVTLVTLLQRRFEIHRAFRRGARRDVREILRFAIPLWLAGLLRQFRRNVQSILLGTMATVSSVGVFSIVGRVSSVASVSSLSIYVSSRPAMAQLHDRGDRETLTGLYTATTRWTLGLNLPFFLVMVLFADPLLLLFGEDFGEGATALTIMAFGELVNAGTGTCQGMLDMTGHTRAKLANTVLWTVLLIGGSALAIPRWGIVGAATASFVAIAAVNVAALIEVRVLERIQPYDRTFWKPVVAAVGALVVGIVVQGFLPVGSHLGRLVLEGGLVGLVYVGLIFLLGLAPDDRLVLERAWAKVTKRSGRSRPVPETAGGSR